MGDTLTLAELKAQNAEEEKEPELEPEAEPEKEPEAEPEAQPEPEAEPEEEGEKGEKKELEPWMQSDLEEDEAPPINDSEAAKIRRKYKAKVNQAKEETDAARQENEELRKRLEALETGQNSQPHPDRPKRDDFKSEDAYLEKLADWKIDTRLAEQSSQQTAAQRKAAQEAEAQQTEELVDGHYLRAAKLAEKSGISPESYQAADQRVRAAVEAKYPGGGDAVVDKLISVVGEGSERVFYNLGVNKARLNEFLESLDKDQGLATTALLGRLNAELKSPTKRQSQAPAPGDDVSGDAAASTLSQKLEQKYKKAKDTQEAYNLKKQAKEQGIDTSGWQR